MYFVLLSKKSTYGLTNQKNNICPGVSQIKG